MGWIKLALFLALMTGYCATGLAQNHMITRGYKPPRHAIVFENQKLLGISVKEYIYYYAYYDPESDLMLDEEDILMIGDNVSYFATYPEYRIDSLSYKTMLDMKTLYSDVWDDLIDKWNVRFTRRRVFRTHDEKDMLKVYDRVGMDVYWYKEAQPEFDWAVSDETRQIGPYRCRKATTTFRGRDWVAWFTEEIPVAEGPWKFAGLPGLIVQVQDTAREHTFSLSRVREAGNPILLPELLASRTERLKFLEKKRAYARNPLLFFGGVDLRPKDASGNPVNPDPTVKRFVNFIEKD